MSKMDDAMKWLLIIKLLLKCILFIFVKFCNIVVLFLFVFFVFVFWPFPLFFHFLGSFLFLYWFSFLYFSFAVSLLLVFLFISFLFCFFVWLLIAFFSVFPFCLWFFLDRQNKMHTHKSTRNKIMETKETK